jgi:hypothetical protein
VKGTVSAEEMRLQGASAGTAAAELTRRMVGGELDEDAVDKIAKYDANRVKIATTTT